MFEKGALRPDVLQIPVSAQPGEVVEISVSIPIPEPPRKSKPLKGVFRLVDAQDRRFGSLWIRVVIEPVPGMQLHPQKKNKYKDVAKEAAQQSKKAKKQQAKKLQKAEKHRLKEEEKRLKQALKQQKDAEKREKQALQQALQQQKQLEKQQKQQAKALKVAQQQAKRAEKEAKRQEREAQKAAARQANEAKQAAQQLASAPIQQQAPVAEVVIPHAQSVVSALVSPRAVPVAQPVVRFQRQAEMLRDMGFDYPLPVLSAILEEHRGNVERVAVALLSGN